MGEEEEENRGEPRRTKEEQVEETHIRMKDTPLLMGKCRRTRADAFSCIINRGALHHGHTIVIRGDLFRLRVTLYRVRGRRSKCISRKVAWPSRGVLRHKVFSG